MAKILSCTECEGKNDCNNCPFPKHPNGCNESDCLTCPNHCPCCIGHDLNVCSQCPEEECDNRNAPYNPNSVSQKEE